MDSATSTGAKHDADLRRRNVPDSGKASTPTIVVEHDGKKTKPGQVKTDTSENANKLR